MITYLLIGFIISIVGMAIRAWFLAEDAKEEGFDWRMLLVFIASMVIQTIAWPIYVIVEVIGIIKLSKM